MDLGDQLCGEAQIEAAGEPGPDSSDDEREEGLRDELVRLKISDTVEASLRRMEKRFEAEDMADDDDLDHVHSIGAHGHGHGHMLQVGAKTFLQSAVRSNFNVRSKKSMKLKAIVDMAKAKKA